METALTNPALGVVVLLGIIVSVFGARTGMRANRMRGTDDLGGAAIEQADRVHSSKSQLAWRLVLIGLLLQFVGAASIVVNVGLRAAYEMKLRCFRMEYAGWSPPLDISMARVLPSILVLEPRELTGVEGFYLGRTLDGARPGLMWQSRADSLVVDLMVGRYDRVTIEVGDTTLPWLEGHIVWAQPDLPQHRARAVASEVTCASVKYPESGLFGVAR